MNTHPVEVAIEMILPALFRVTGDQQDLARSTAENLMNLIDTRALHPKLDQLYRAKMIFVEGAPLIHNARS